MRQRSTRARGARWRVAAMVAALPLVVTGALASCSDTKPPDYHVPDTALRLIPEEGAVGAAGGTVFVLVELRQPAGDAGARPVIVYVRAKGATSESLPGPALCGDPDGGTGGDAGGEADAEVPDAATPDAGAAEVSADLTIPDVALVARDTFNARTSGFLVTIPSGTQPVELVATAYTHGGAAGECHPGDPQILAIGAARIERREPDAGGGGAGGHGGGSTSSSGAGGHGGSGGAGTGTGTGTGSTGGGGAGSGGKNGGAITDGG